MTVTATYDATLSRVRVDADGLAAADYATLERSTDQIQWTFVRGGTNVAVAAGEFEAPVDDYEFVAGVTNYYRVRGIVTDPISFVAAGTGHSSANAGGTGTISPGMPASIVVGDLLVAMVSARNTAARVVVPTGWTMMREDDNFAFVGRRYQSGDLAPTWSWTSDVDQATLLGVIFALRNAELVPVTGASQANSSAQNVAYPALTIPADNLAVIVAGWKQDDQTGTATLAGMTEIADQWDTIGDDAAQVADYVIQTAKANISAGSFTVSGGASAVSRGTVLALRHADYLNEQSATATPQLDRIWLKSPTRPFLNRAVTVVGWDDVTRPARSAVHNVVGRSYPIAVGDVRGSRQWTLEIYTEDASARQTIDYVLASGDVLFVHTPAGCEVPGGYVRVGESAENRTRPRGATRVFALPCTEVAPPGPDMTYAQSTWATVLALYPTWDALLAAHPTWDSVLGLLGDPSEVVVA